MLRGAVPPGRNGHTATLADGKIIIIGGWLGSGPLAASDLYILDVSDGPDNLRWFQPVRAYNMIQIFCDQDHVAMSCVLLMHVSFGFLCSILNLVI